MRYGRVILFCWGSPLNSDTTFPTERTKYFGVQTIYGGIQHLNMDSLFFKRRLSGCQFSHTPIDSEQPHRAIFSQSNQVFFVALSWNISHLECSTSLQYPTQKARSFTTRIRTFVNYSSKSYPVNYNTPNHSTTQPTNWTDTGGVGGEGGGLATAAAATVTTASSVSVDGPLDADREEDNNREVQS